ncbi:MAG: hypothetical protein KGS44_00675 [Alphaproteobacteria bacterium]|nr:hypothetical protein [Alphaproteobacteria bacterium]
MSKLVSPSETDAAQKPEIRKYAFDLVFDAAGQAMRRQDRQERRFSQDELEAARAEGERAGRADAAAAAEAALAVQLAAAARAAQRLEAALERETAVLRQEAARLALAMAKVVAGRALEAFGTERVIDAFDIVLETLGGETRLVVRVGEDGIEGLRPRLQETAKAHGFTGSLLVRAAEGMGHGDVAIEWGDGAVRLDTAALIARLEATLAQEEWGLAASGTQEP